MLGPLLCTVCFAHVPTYSTGCPGNCCQLSHPHGTSQVVYLKGSGGVEIHLHTDNNPIDTLTPEVLDVDAVFRDKIDQSTYSLHVGCGGCAPDDPVVTEPLRLRGYTPATLEPFTQVRGLFVLTLNRG